MQNLISITRRFQVSVFRARTHTHVATVECTERSSSNALSSVSFNVKRYTVGYVSTVTGTASLSNGRRLTVIPAYIYTAKHLCWQYVVANVSTVWYRHSKCASLCLQLQRSGPSVDAIISEYFILAFTVIMLLLDCMFYSFSIADLLTCCGKSASCLKKKNTYNETSIQYEKYTVHYWLWCLRIR